MLFRIFILILSCLLGLQSYGQQYPLLEQKVTLVSPSRSVANQIEKLGEAANINIIFSPQLFEKNANKSIDFVEAKLGEVLLYLLAGEFVNFKLIGNEIVLFKSLPDERYTVNGFVLEKESGEGIISASIVEPFLNKGTYSNAYGFYSLTLPKGFHNIKYFSFTNLDTEGFLYLDRDTTINKYLETTLTLTEVVVTSKDSAEILNIKDISREKITSSEVLNAPALGGESDLVRTAFLKPGVQSGGDGLGGLFVRGGGLDQNLVLLDGVPVYNASHIIGIFSIFNSDAIRSSELFKGAIPSRFGGRLSSVLDVRTKEGNEKEFNASAGIGLMSMKASVEGPFKKEAASFFVSYRRSILDLYLKPLTNRTNQNNGIDGFSDYLYQDLNVKLNSKFGDRDRVYFSLYFGGDRYNDNRSWSRQDSISIVNRKEGQKLGWGNGIGSFRWNHIFGNKIFSNTTVTFSRYNFNSRTFFGSEEIAFDSLSLEAFDIAQFTSSITDIALKQDFEFFPNPNHNIRFGINAVQHRFTPNAIIINELNGLDVNFANGLDVELLSNQDKQLQVFDGAAYIEDDFKINEKIAGNIGVRGTVFNTANSRFYSLQPRVNLNYQPIPKLNIFASYDKLDQPLHLLQRSGIGLPSDLWVPSSDSIRPNLGWQTVLGAKSNLIENLEIGVEAYYKHLDNLITYKEGLLSQIDAENWESQVTTGSGLAQGIEFWVSKKKGKNTWSINYTLAKTTRQFDEISNGESYPFRYDRRHFLKALLYRKISDRWTFSASWVLGTGNGVTLPTAEVTLPSNNPEFPNLPITVQFFDKINDFRLPEYHRLDLAVNMRIVKPRITQQLQLGIFNVYNRLNPLFITIRESVEEPGVNQPQVFSLLPILPSFSYSVKLK